eukprot:7885122-Pyramimonas_sp.AAC.1
MAKRMAYLIAHQGREEDIEGVDEIHATEAVGPDFDFGEYNNAMRELTKRYSASTVRAVKRAYISLGHPPSAALATAMQNAKAPAEWIQRARVFQCEICMKRQRPRPVRVAVLPKANRFNQVVCTDVYYTMWKKKERNILAIMDELS